MELKSDNLHMSKPFHSISQLPELSPSMSIRSGSEPLNIKDWFPSYVYESPDLSLDVGLMASLRKDSNKCPIPSSVPVEEHEKVEYDSPGYGNVGKAGRLGNVEKADTHFINESEISAVPESLQAETQLSEPHDIRNWFSSSIHESPDLSSDSGFVASSLRECKLPHRGLNVDGGQQEEEENLVGSNYATETSQTGVFQNKGSLESEISVVPDSLSSESQLSDPPDIRNMFSSYMYESPLLTIDLVQNLHEEIEHGGDRHINERRKEEDCKNVVMDDGRMSCCEEIAVGSKGSFANNPDFDHLLKSATSSVTSSQFSEPPRLSNLFSSYFYDSPELNTADGFKESVYNQKESQEDVLVAQGSEIDKLEYSSYASDRVDQTDSWKKLGSGKDGRINAKQQNPPNQEQEELPGMVATERSGRRVVQKKERSPQVNLDDSLSKSGPKMNPKQISSEASLDNLVNQDSTCNPIGRSCNKENDRADINSDGFISTKKRINRSLNDENDSRRPSVLNKCSGMKPAASPKITWDCIHRKPLSETTNLPVPQVDVSSGTAGKWRCPQKSKPNLGPPMKQLRLEKWVQITNAQTGLRND